MSAIWELPFKGNRFVEGWQLGVITQGQTGNPINIVTNLDTSRGNANIRPDLVGPIEVVGQPEQWFSTGVCDPRIAGSCTAQLGVRPARLAGRQFHFGNLRAQRGHRDPASTTPTCRSSRRRASAGATVEFRAEAFNVFNHPNFGFRLAARTATVGSTSFGVITATRLPTGDSGSARQIQFALKVLF